MSVQEYAAEGVQEYACGALLNLAEDHGALAKMRASVIRAAVAASDASEHTEKWGQKLLEKL